MTTPETYRPMLLPEIQISLRLHGNHGIAEGGGGFAQERTLALALSQLIKKLSKNPELKGRPWIVPDQPQLRGRL